MAPLVLKDNGRIGDWTVSKADFDLRQQGWQREYRFKNQNQKFFVTIGKRAGKLIVAINAVDNGRDETMFMFIEDGVIMNFSGKSIYLWDVLTKQCGLPKNIVAELSGWCWMKHVTQFIQESRSF